MVSKAHRCVPLLALCIAVGCAARERTGDSAVSGSSEQAAKLKSQASFEQSKDPPISADTHFAAGQLAESQQVHDRALQQYSLALKRDPTHAGALFRLGALQTELKQFPQAVTTWTRYIKLTNSPEGYSNLGYCYELWGRRGAAEAAYKTGIARDPDNQPCRVNYGLMLARQGRIRDATEQLGAVLTPAEVYYNLGSVHEQQGRRDDAREAYRKAIQIDPSMREAHDRLAAME